MRFFAPFIVLFGIVIATLANACSYDWKYSDPEDDGGSSGKEGGSSGGSREGGSGGPPKGDCSIAKPCATGICVFGGNQCSGLGNCVDGPCTDEEVCTCKGDRMSRCDAAKGALAIDESGSACPSLPPKALFDCYQTAKCVVKEQYCKTKGGADNTCVNYPAGCSADCSCTGLPQAPCTCTTDPNGNVIIKC